jgi:hypothetical protein
MSGNTTLTPRETADLLMVMIPAKLPVLLVSAPAIGKTSITNQVGQSLGWDMETIYTANSDPTDAKGAIYCHDDVARFVPFAQLDRLIKATRPTLAFLDELGQASESVQKAFMHLILARKVDTMPISEHVSFVAATNRREDRAGVSGLLEPVKSRFSTIIHMVHSVDDWCDFMADAGYPAIDCAFIRFRPDLLSQFKPSADMTNSPSPRGWEAVAKIGQLGLTGKLRQAAVFGAVGQAAGMERLAFDSVYGELPDLRTILLKPKTAKVYDEPGILWALTAALASNADASTMEDTFTYLLRCPKEFLLFALKTIQRRDKNVLATSPAVMDWLANNTKLFLPTQK